MSLADQQFALIRRMASLDPAPCFMGGFAEDALLAGTVTRPHGDIDWILPRRQLELRLAQAAQLGFEDFEVRGEAAPGEAFYLSAQNGDLQLELGITDEEDGELRVKVHKILFEVSGKEAPAGYQVHLPSDTFAHPPTEIDGVPIWPASPLALYQLRIGIAKQESFGELSERHLESMRRLRKRFFPNHAEAELAPRIDQLTGPE